VKKLFLLAILAATLAPLGLGKENYEKEKKHKIRATEMFGVGIGAAALVGAAGYLVLRRRHTA